MISKNINKSTETRDVFIIGACGVNKTGKSSTFRAIAESWRNSRDKSFRVAGHDPQRMFSGLIDKNLYLDPENKNWALDCCKLRRCLLILDELKMLCPIAQHPPIGLVKLLSNCYYNEVDIMWMVHNPSLVPEIFTYYTTKYYIFLTFSKEGQFQKKIPNYSLCTAASNYVNTYVRIHGKGKHKLDPEYKGQGFPYGIVDTEKQKVVLVNMPKKLNINNKTQ